MADAGVLFPDWQSTLHDGSTQAIDTLVAHSAEPFERFSNGPLGLLVAIDQALPMLVGHRKPLALRRGGVIVTQVSVDMVRELLAQQK